MPKVNQTLKVDGALRIRGVGRRFALHEFNIKIRGTPAGTVESAISGGGKLVAVGS